MDLSTVFSPEHYHWKLGLLLLGGSILLPQLVSYLVLLIPTLKQMKQLNVDVAAQRRTRDHYKRVQTKSMMGSLMIMLVIYLLIVPFVVTAEAQPWWRIVFDIFVILMVYDFFYYVTHRFVFHDGGFGPGPLMWVHAVHHQQHNPCRLDSSYLHIIEPIIGAGLFGATIGLLGWLMHDFSVFTILAASIAFAEVNLHNHDRMETDRFPYKYLKYASDMHHVHHKRFDSGNFATITLFYDWLFGTYDTGLGWGKKKRAPKPVATTAANIASASDEAESASA